MILRMPSVVALALAALAVGGFAEAARPGGNSSSASSSDDYRTLVRNNMFLKNRANAGDAMSGVAAPALTPLQSTVLTGVVHQDGQYIAFLENILTNATTKAQLGDTVCDGRISRITMDSIDYVHNGVSTRVEIGKNLEGTDRAALAAAIAPAASSTQDATAPAAARAASGGAALPSDVILQRMRQRRLRETGR